MKREHTWDWPIAVYLFLGGLGGGMMIISTGADLFFDAGNIFVLGNFATAVLIGLGSCMLIFELSKPMQFWRVFSRQKSIITFGAWMLSLLIVVSIVYGTFWLPFMPWQYLVKLRIVLAWIGLILGLGVVIYTGVFLGSLKARPFWNWQALPVLFLISALSTGIDGQYILLRFYAPVDVNRLASAESLLAGLNCGLIVLELIALMVYILTMHASKVTPAVRASASLLKGKHMLVFWIALVGMGMICPVILYFVGTTAASLAASALVLVGGLILRFLVVYANDRAFLPGEEKFSCSLPDGNEDFLRSWEEKST